MQPYPGPLLGFAGERVEARGYVDLMTTFGHGRLAKTLNIRYLIVDADTSYYALIERKTLNELGAVVSTPHLKMKFPSTSGEIVTVSADQKQARQWYVASLKASPPNLSTPKSGETQSTPQGHVMCLHNNERYDPVDVNPRDDTLDHGPKPVEKLIQLQLGE